MNRRMLLQSLKIRLKRIPLVCYLYNKITYWKWLCCNKPVPPPHIVKQLVVKEYAGKYDAPIFIETGTFRGDMVYAVKDIFREIYSIELSHELYKKAERRFSKYKHISIVEGDSSKVLPEVLNRIEEPCLFWLDGHYSAGCTAKGDKETPIMEELNDIFQHSVDNHVILIDDAREFRGENDYPALEGLKELVLNKYPAYTFEVEDDIIRIHKDSKSCITNPRQPKQI